MADECLKHDKSDTGITAPSSAFSGKSKSGRHISGDAESESLALFWGLNDPHKFLAKIAAGRSTSNYAKNSEIFVQGGDADSIFYLQEGRVKVTITSEQGKESILGILEAGQFFGDGCLSGQPHRVTTTTTLTPCRITAIEKNSMIKALEDQPWFSNFLMDHLSSRNRRIEGDLMNQLFSSCEQQVTRRLFKKIDVQESLLESVLRDKLAPSIETMAEGA
jgi:CRP/FNR family cyclic AMP-dependent transcriptional regulator